MFHKTYKGSVSLALEGDLKLSAISFRPDSYRPDSYRDKLTGSFVLVTSIKKLGHLLPRDSEKLSAKSWGLIF